MTLAHPSPHDASVLDRRSQKSSGEPVPGRKTARVASQHARYAREKLFKRFSPLRYGSGFPFRFSHRLFPKTSVIVRTNKECARNMLAWMM